jgi:hypothetical protein
LRTNVLPTIRAGAAKRKSCQKGKFQGITARSNPQRLEDDLAVRGIGLHVPGSQEVRGMAGIVITDPGTLADLGLRLRDRLPHLQGDELGVTRRVLTQEGSDEPEPSAPLGDGISPPRREGGRGLGECLVDLGRGEGVEGYEHLSGCRID